MNTKQGSARRSRLTKASAAMAATLMAGGIAATAAAMPARAASPARLRPRWRLRTSRCCARAAGARRSMLAMTKLDIVTLQKAYAEPT